MKTPQKRIFLLACLGLTVATITFAGKIDVPSPPGRPSACDINVKIFKTHERWRVTNTILSY